MGTASHMIISKKGLGKCDLAADPRYYKKNLITDIYSENRGTLLRAGR